MYRFKFEVKFGREEAGVFEQALPAVLPFLLAKLGELFAGKPADDRKPDGNGEGI